MKPKSIDLANRCGSCCWFEPIAGTCSGYCLQNKYGENVVCDPEHPYWQVQRSRVKCADYNKKLPTNADHIRSMTDEELAKFIIDSQFNVLVRVCEAMGRSCPTTREYLYGDTPEQLEWLKQPYKEET